MDRRSFIVRFFAAIAAFVLGLWPWRKAKAAGEFASDTTCLSCHDPEVPDAPEVEPEEDPEPEYQQRIEQHVDIEKMLDAISTHTRETGDQIVQADDPMRLMLGYAAISSARPQDRKIWQIRLSALRSSLDAWEKRAAKEEVVPEESVLPMIAKVHLVRHYIKTSEGRLALAMAFPGQRSKPAL